MAKSKVEDMKILYINTVEMTYNGISMTMLNYAKSIRCKNVTLDFVSINSLQSDIKSLIEDMGSKCYELDMRNSNIPVYIYKLSKIIRKNKYSIVHIHGNSATMAIDLLGAYLGGAEIRATHSHNTTCTHMKAHKFLTPLFQVLSNKAFACGKDAGRWLYQSREFQILNNGTDTRKFQYDEAKRDYYLSKFSLEGKIVLGHIGHFTMQKNHSFLIDAFESALKQNDQLVLLLIGEGKLKEEIQKKVRKKNLDSKVIFTGKIVDIPGLLTVMDTMLLPSLWEGLPNVAIEWQAAGIPALVSSNVTKECKLTDQISFVDLVLNDWSRKISNVNKLTCEQRLSNNLRNSEIIISKGYDIKANAEQLLDTYSNQLYQS